jgi:beta-glucosidase/6-phospho-beta-glucosidase/beta-galactosidase
LLFDKFPDDFQWGVATASYQVMPNENTFPWLKEKITFVGYTVKPVLTTTSEQRPPVNNDQIQSGPTKIRTKFTFE